MSMKSIDLQVEEMRERTPAPTLAEPSSIVPTRAQDPELPPPKSPVAYFINFSVNNKKLHDKFPKVRIRIRIPILLVKTVKKTRRISQRCSGIVVNDNNANNTKKRKLFLNRVDSILLKFFGGKNSGTTSSLNGNQHNPDKSNSNDINNREAFHPESKHYTFDQNVSSDLGSFRTVSLSSTDSSNSEKNPVFSSFSLATKSPLCDFRGRDTKQSEICMTCRMLSGKEKEEKYGAPPLFSSFLGFFNCRLPLNFMKGKRSNFCKGSSSANRNSENDGSYRRERGSCSSNSSVAALSGKMGARVTKTEDEDGDDNNGHELCKKRIMIGDRCRPLTFSGLFHYDENATPLPDFPAKSSSF